MSSTVLYMSMSLDGLVAGPNEGPDNGLGDGGERLHEWVLGGNLDEVEGPDRVIVDEFMSTGAVLAGRGTFEPAGGWNGDHHDGVPSSSSAATSRRPSLPTGQASPTWAISMKR